MLLFIAASCWFLAMLWQELKFLTMSGLFFSEVSLAKDNDLFSDVSLERLEN